MLENLQAGVPMPMDRQGNQAQQMMNNLGHMMQRQQDLLQQSYQAQRGQQQGQQQGEGQPGGQGQGQQADGGLQAAQQDLLRQDLGSLMRQFGNMMGDLPQGMGQAEQSMRNAVQALNKGEFGDASEAQNQA